MNLFHSQLKAKISKLKEKLQNLEKVEELNLNLQNELLKQKEHICSSSSSNSNSTSMKGLLAKITPIVADNEVSDFRNVHFHPCYTDIDMTIIILCRVSLYIFMELEELV